jgi:hypothetical protein
MKSILFSFILISFLSHAECDPEPLKKAVKDHFKIFQPIKDERGQSGSVTGKNFVISDFILNIRNENFIIANFDLVINWIEGKEQIIKTIVVASIDKGTCNIDHYDIGDTLGSSMSKL